MQISNTDITTKPLGYRLSLKAKAQREFIMLTLTQQPIEQTKSYIYENDTSRFQIIRIENIPGQHLERTVFPGQSILFETSPEAILNIYSGPMMSTLLEDHIPCHQLPQMPIMNNNPTSSQQIAIAA